jgi:L-rhamnonate dehydratase
VSVPSLYHSCCTQSILLNLHRTYSQLKEACPGVKFTTGEHEYSKYGFRKLIEGRHVDIIQPDVMWMGGLTELIKVAAMAAAYDIPVVPHG